MITQKVEKQPENFTGQLCHCPQIMDSKRDIPYQVLVRIRNLYRELYHRPTSVLDPMFVGALASPPKEISHHRLPHEML